MSTFYLDYENGNDTNDGSDWAHAWKTITSGATAARIAPGDIIRIAKSPAPTPLAGTTATWTNLSKTVTLNTAETANIEMCEADWTPVNATSSAKIGTDWKEGTYAVKIVEDGTPGANEVQAYYDIYTHDTTVHDLSGYQKISFWIKNEVAISANQWEINLCSNADGTGDVDTFAIPAIPSTGYWIPLTIARTGGGNLGSAIKSINISNGSGTPTASKYIYIDNIIACTTSGLNLQSLISKNTLEQSTVAATGYGNEGWYGIQSINGTTVLLDNGVNTKANAGNGYSTAGTTPETVNTYKRETIKTSLVSSSTTDVQAIQDSGDSTGNIQFQGGYDTSTNEQTGETFFDGLSGNGYGLNISKNFITINHISLFRYYRNIYVYGFLNFFDTISDLNNSIQYGLYFDSGAYNNTINNLLNCSNGAYGIGFGGSTGQNIINYLISKSNTSYGIYFSSTTGNNNNIIKSLTTIGNTTAAVGYTCGINYILKASISETAKAAGNTNNSDCKLFINDVSNYSYIWCDRGNILSQSATAGGTGTEWKMSPTDSARNINYPLTLSVAKIAVNADKAVSVSVYIKKSHATDIGAKLVCRGKQLSGVDSDVTTTAPDDTSRNLVSLADFTPTESGVIEIEVWAYWAANTADENIIIDDISITQAD